jgi:hypothetical protein
MKFRIYRPFPQFRDPVLKHTLHSVEDKFAINYGTGGIGAEILANRLGVGPMFACTECKYEEFFLSAWTVGDPAQIVDKPANTTNSTGQLIPREEGHEGLISRRPIECAPQLYRRPGEDESRSRGTERAPHSPPARAPVVANTRRRQLDLPR